jgi:PRTRC genetic system protein E
MDFFKTLQSLQIKGTWTLVIKTNGTDLMNVTILLTPEKTNDDAFKKLVPLALTNTPEILDEKFFDAISVPMQKTKIAFDTSADYLKALEEATAKTRMEQDKDKAVKKEETERKKKYDAQMAKVKELEDKGTFGQAIGQMPKEKDFPEFVEEIKAKLEELRKKHGELFV